MDVGDAENRVEVPCLPLVAGESQQLYRVDVGWVRVIAEQSGPSRVSMTRDLYLGRRASNADTLLILRLSLVARGTWDQLPKRRAISRACLAPPRAFSAVRS